MLFNSWQFAIFLPIIFILYWYIPNRFRNYLLLLGSYYFYLSWNVELISLILGTTVVSYICALGMGYTKKRITKNLLLVTCLVSSLGALFFFKYFDFASMNITYLFNQVGIDSQVLILNLILPVGISFYTFQTLSYVIDVYNQKVNVEKNFIIYALYVSFFPQLVAGPIERPENLLPQLRKNKKFDYIQASEGLKIMLIGFFKKLVIADFLSLYVDLVYTDSHSYKGLALIVATVFFAIQIYCDFSGYSDIAIGTGKLFGINLMKNFDSPYFSRSIKEFWRRWHISLSSWFMDYIYIPLGGSRVKLPRYYFNILITFIVSGIWHGASWNFIVWGAMHGILMVGEHSSRKIKSSVYKAIKINKNGRIANIFQTLMTFILVLISWVFFRAKSIEDAIYIIRNSFVIEMSFNSVVQIIRTIYVLAGYDKLYLMTTAIAILLLALYDYYSLRFDLIKKSSNLNWFARYSIYFIIIIITYIHLLGATAKFIYFQF